MGGFTGWKDGECYYYGEKTSSKETSSNQKKECPTCKGSKRTNGHYVKRWRNMSQCPSDNKEVDVWEDEECNNCKGKGYLELKWT